MRIVENPSVIPYPEKSVSIGQVYRSCNSCVSDDYLGVDVGSMLRVPTLEI